MVPHIGSINCMQWLCRSCWRTCFHALTYVRARNLHARCYICIVSITAHVMLELSWNERPLAGQSPWAETGNALVRSGCEPFSFQFRYVQDANLMVARVAGLTVGCNFLCLLGFIMHGMFFYCLDCPECVLLLMTALLVQAHFMIENPLASVVPWLHNVMHAHG